MYMEVCINGFTSESVKKLSNVTTQGSLDKILTSYTPPNLIYIHMYVYIVIFTYIYYT
jgi:hypothetical protein